jgi:hypothetical protein
MNNIIDKKRAFEYKLHAAKYHLTIMKNSFEHHKQQFVELSKHPNAHTPKELMPFFYSYNSFLYELYSCFDIMLYYVTLKHNINIVERNIGWNDGFKAELKLKSPEAYESISKECDKWWLEDLRRARNYITHHDRPSLGIESNNDDIHLFFYIPGLHERRELFEQCNIWGKSTSKLFQGVE